MAGPFRHLPEQCPVPSYSFVATERLSVLADDRVLYALKNRWRDGTTHVAFEPADFVARLAALVPPPRFHLVRYSGILAPAARFRARVVPEGPEPAARVASHPGCPTDRKHWLPFWLQVSSLDLGRTSLHALTRLLIRAVCG